MLSCHSGHHMHFVVEMERRKCKYRMLMVDPPMKHFASDESRVAVVGGRRR